MKTRNVFVDTQAFMRQGFKFENKVLARLAELGKDGKINIYISEVVGGEVVNKIQEKLDEVTQAGRTLTKKLSILESDTPQDLSVILDEYSGDRFKEIGLSRWSSYINESKIQVLDSSSVCVKDILDKYFEGSFPFSSGKKKNEFPDAISLHSLLGWLDIKSEEVYVISDDSDLSGFCQDHDSCHSINELAEFLDIYNRAEVRLTDIIHTYFVKQEAWVVKEVSEAIESHHFLYGDNYDADVENVSVGSLSISDIDIIDVQKDICVAEFTIDVEFTADVSGPNFDASIWDSEERRYVFTEMFDENLDLECASVVTVDITFDEEIGELIEVLYVAFNRGEPIQVYVDDGYPYK